MADKVPVTIMVDPEVETEFTIKPFAAGLATKIKHSGVEPLDGFTATATGTSLTGHPDVDADVDYNG